MTNDIHALHYYRPMSKINLTGLQISVCILDNACNQWKFICGPCTNETMLTIQNYATIIFRAQLDWMHQLSHGRCSSWCTCWQLHIEGIRPDSNKLLLKGKQPIYYLQSVSKKIQHPSEQSLIQTRKIRLIRVTMMIHESWKKPGHTLQRFDHHVWPGLCLSWSQACSIGVMVLVLHISTIIILH